MVRVCLVGNGGALADVLVAVTTGVLGVKVSMCNGV